jgi:hypothetical protein
VILSDPVPASGDMGPRQPHGSLADDMKHGTADCQRQSFLI